MAKAITTTAPALRAPTEQQAMLLRMAGRKSGVSRAEVREALGYEPGANIPVQRMLKQLAERRGLKFWAELVEQADSARLVGLYHIEGAAPRKAVRAAAAAVERPARKAAKKAAKTPAKRKTARKAKRAAKKA